MPAFSTSPIMSEGPADGPVAILLHGFPYDIHSLCGCRIRNWRRRAAASSSPTLRGFGATRFRDPATLRSGEQAAIGADVDLADGGARHIRRAVLAGHNWGGRAACVAAALWPERLPRHGDREQLPDPGPRARRGADQPETRSRALVRILRSARARAGRAGRATGARSPGCCGSSGRPAWDFDDATFERSARGARQSRIMSMS